MSDLFGIGIPEEWTKRVLGLIRANPVHRFYLLTKQPQNLVKFSPFPDSCYVGVTATNRDMWGNANLYLSSIQAKVKYFSLEPLLGDIVGQPNTAFATEALINAGINWLIIGACTGANFEMGKLTEDNPGLSLMKYGNKWTAQPKIEWVSEIVQAADKAGVKVFLKNNLKPLLDSEGCPKWAFEQPTDWDIHRRLRQEMPNGI